MEGDIENKICFHGKARVNHPFSNECPLCEQIKINAITRFELNQEIESLRSEVRVQQHIQKILREVLNETVQR